ncbi:hypothetical protein OF83DRAFT_1088422, partial [Amylostereum chailletii]
LAKTLEGLLAEGKLDAGSKPGKELLELKDRMERKLAEALAERPAAADANAEDGPTTAVYNHYSYYSVLHEGYIRKTFDIVRRAVEDSPGRRQLVHLMDVQNSVERNLAQVNGVRAGMGSYPRRGRMAEVNLDHPEESEDDQRKNALMQSSVFNTLQNGGVSAFGADNL